MTAIRISLGTVLTVSGVLFSWKMSTVRFSVVTYLLELFCVMSWLLWCMTYDECLVAYAAKLEGRRCIRLSTASSCSSPLCISLPACALPFPVPTSRQQLPLM